MHKKNISTGNSWITYYLGEEKKKSCVIQLAIMSIVQYLDVAFIHIIITVENGKDTFRINHPIGLR